MNIVRYFRHRLKTLRGMTVIHVGAHHGQEMKRYNSMFVRKVIWIEANPNTFETLKANIEESQAAPPGILHRLLGIAPTEHVCINALITEEDGVEREFFQFNRSVADSIFRFAPEGPTRSIKESGDVLRLRSSTLDTILRESGQNPAETDVLVMDIQGSELLCLNGAEATLTNVQYIETEIATRPVYEGGVLYDELNSRLRELGFRRKTMIRRSHMNAIYKSDGLRRAA